MWHTVWNIVKLYVATNSTYSFDAMKEIIEILGDVYLKIENVISIEFIETCLVARLEDQNLI